MDEVSESEQKISRVDLCYSGHRALVGVNVASQYSCCFVDLATGIAAVDTDSDPKAEVIFGPYTRRAVEFFG